MRPGHKEQQYLTGTVIWEFTLTWQTTRTLDTLFRPRRGHLNHFKTLRDYSTQIHTSYQKTTMRADSLWSDFISAFRTHTIISWKRRMLTECRDFHLKRGIHIIPGRTRSQFEAMIDVLYWDD